MLFAVLWFSLPSAMEMGADAPTPMRSASEKFIITRGIAIFTAANAPSPSICPIKIPSIMLYTDIANMLTIPGIATTKNSRHGFMVAYIISAFVFVDIIISL